MAFRYNTNGFLNFGGAPIMAGASAIGLGEFQQRERDRQESNRRFGASAGAQAGRIVSEGFEDQNRLEAMKLQMAHEQRMQALHGAPTPAGPLYFKGNGGPFSDSISAAKRLAAGTALQGVTLSPEQENDLDTLAKDPTLGVNEFQDVVTRMASASNQQRKLGQQEKDITDKQNYVRSVWANIPPEHREGLKALAMSAEVSPATLRAAVGQIQGEQTGLRRQQTGLEVQAIDKQITDLAAQMKQLEKQLQDSGFTPGVNSPASLNPSVQNADASTFGSMGFGESLKDAFLPGHAGQLVAGGDPATLMTYTAYARLQQQANALMQKRQQLVGSLTSGAPAPQQQAAPSVAAQMSDDDLLKALSE